MARHDLVEDRRGRQHRSILVETTVSLTLARAKTELHVVSTLSTLFLLETSVPSSCRALTMTDLLISTSDLTQEVAIRKAKGKIGELPAVTVMQNFNGVVEKYGDKPALHQKVITKASRFVPFLVDKLNV